MFSSGVPTFNNYSSFDLKAKSSDEQNYFHDYESGSTSNRIISKQFQLIDYHVFHLTNGNYIPLQFDDEKSGAANKNTGYIIGTGLTDDETYTTLSSPRISSYSSSYLSGSVTNDKITSVKTYDNGEWKTITETKDEDGYVTGTENVSFLSGKYAKARNAVATAIEGQDAIHGIHFDVSTSNKYTDDYYRGSIYEGAYIEETMLLKSYDGTPKTTRMPKGCIDFELEDSGYITFFAGMYNMTASISSLNYFSLFKVNRSSPTSYTLSEIKKVYKYQIK